MNTSPKKEPGRVLVIGRSPSVLLATVEILRAKGYSADTTNQFDRVLDDYDVTELDVLVFGGMVPADTKQRLREDISERNPHVTFIQGLAGIAGLIAAQVQAVTSPETAGSGEVVYDAAQRSVRLVLDDSAAVAVEAWWLTSFVPPEPKSASMNVFDGRLDAGSHTVPLPERVPSEGSFAAVTVGSSTRVFTVGPLPEAVRRLAPASAADDRLPEVGRVSTGTDGR
ncbi:hypothetical protein [Actinomadura verrucosospora]|uniref:Uncharacterized protein n=1 Tax=Actinomadura verrucosospora TaxID=46165 RepID=A0A7D3ZJL8_ACTVE|nr:hypothetical protein [Actinomadura verrucosospora]QKG19862.1 hypothetical protein ACTIVE_1498 [Actinomadura verrucosospora]